MATQEKKLEIWKHLSNQMGCPPKDSEEYFQKTETYYRILEELNAQVDDPPPQRAPVAHVKVQSMRAEPIDHEFNMQRQRGVCYCDCHRMGGEKAPLAAPSRHKVTRGNSTSDSDSDSNSDGSYRSRASRPKPHKKLKERLKEKPQEIKRPRGRPRRIVSSDSESASDSEVEEKPKLKRKVEVSPPKKKTTKKSNTKRASK